MLSIRRATVGAAVVVLAAMIGGLVFGVAAAVLAYLLT